MYEGMSSARAIIVAAGRGSRMGQHTAEQPKCLLEFAGKPLLEWQLTSLRAAGVTDVTLVGGYRADMLEGFGLPVVRNQEWAETNMVYSLMCAHETFLAAADNPVIVCYSDIVYESRVLRALLAASGEAATVVDRNWADLWKLRFENPLDDAETLDMDADGALTDIGQKADSMEQIKGQYIGLTRFSPAAAGRFVEAHQAIGEMMPGKTSEKCYFTDILKAMIMRGEKVQAALTDGGWLEFDSGTDRAAFQDLLERNELGRFWSPENVTRKGVAG